MKRLAGLNESLAKVFSLGKTYENRTMYAIKVCNTVFFELIVLSLFCMSLYWLRKLVGYSTMNILAYSKLSSHGARQESLFRKKILFLIYMYMKIKCVSSPQELWNVRLGGRAFGGKRELELGEVGRRQRRK